MFRDNWLNFGFEHGDRSRPFVIDYSKAHDVEPGPALDVAIDVARELHDRYGNPTLLLSGGIDSQAMAYAFKMAGLTPKCIAYRYKNGVNDYDIFTDFYNHHEMDVDIVEFDVVNFFENELPYWAKTYDCHSPEMLTHMKYAAVTDADTVIYAGSLVTSEGIVGEMNYSQFGLERYARLSGKRVVGYFFNYCPRLVRSFSSTPSALRFANEPLIAGPHNLKCTIYQEAGFPVMPQMMQFDGFEILREEYDEKPVSFRTKLAHKGEASARPYDLLFTYPLKRLASYSDDAKTVYRPLDLIRSAM